MMNFLKEEEESQRRRLAARPQTTKAVSVCALTTIFLTVAVVTLHHHWSSNSNNSLLDLIPDHQHSPSPLLADSERRGLKKSDKKKEKERRKRQRKRERKKAAKERASDNTDLDSDEESSSSSETADIASSTDSASQTGSSSTFTIDQDAGREDEWDLATIDPSFERSWASSLPSQSPATIAVGKTDKVSLSFDHANIFRISASGTEDRIHSEHPSLLPSASPTTSPSSMPSITPTISPSASPTDHPTAIPTKSSQFSISMSFVDVNRQDLYLESAKIWESIIVGGLPSVNTGGKMRMPSGCPKYPKIVDEIHVCAMEIDNDGVGGVLGSAGPHYVRRDSGLPIGGHMRFDRADAARLIQSQRWQNVIIHELGHVLGLGTLWHDGKTDNVNDSLVYQGKEAQRVWSEDWKCVGTPPIELDGGSGTRGGHWDERCFRNELLTGYLSSTSVNPISKLTIAALDDLGYEVDYSRAQPYSPQESCCNGNLYRSRILQDFFEEPKKPSISEDGRRLAESYGRKTLNQIHDEAPENHDTEDLIYVGDSFLSVMYEENGYFYQVDVTVSR